MRICFSVLALVCAVPVASACDVPRARLAFMPSYAPDVSCQALGVCPPAQFYAPPQQFFVPRAPVYSAPQFDCAPAAFSAPVYAPQRVFVQRQAVYAPPAFLAAPAYAPGVQLNVNVQSRSRGLLGGILGGGRLFGGRDRDVFRQRTIVRGRGVGAAAFGY